VPFEEEKLVILRGLRGENDKKQKNPGIAVGAL